MYVTLVGMKQMENIAECMKQDTCSLRRNVLHRFLLSSPLGSVGSWDGEVTSKTSFSASDKFHPLRLLCKISNIKDLQCS